MKKSNLIKDALHKYKYVVLIFLLSLVYYARPLLSNRLTTHDLPAVFLNYYLTFYNAAHNFGEIALWTPGILSGYPLLGNIQTTLFYPFTLLFYLIDPIKSINFIILIHIFLSGVFTFLFCRKIKIGEHGSLIAAVVFMFSGPMIARINLGHLPYIYSVI